MPMEPGLKKSKLAFLAARAQPTIDQMMDFGNNLKELTRKLESCDEPELVKMGHQLVDAVDLFRANYYRTLTQHPRTWEETNV